MDDVRGVYMNPWKDISLSDYEKHMSLENVKQIQVLNQLMKRQFGVYEDFRRDTKIYTEFEGFAMILGVAGGNGLEHITAELYEKIYAVDINADYLAAVKERFSDIGGKLECLELDLITEYDKLPKADYLIADLLVEYIGYETFQKVIKKVGPEQISCVIQINPEAGPLSEWVSESPYLHAFDGLDQVHHQMDAVHLCRALKEIGYDEIPESVISVPLPNGKSLQLIDFALPFQRIVQKYRYS